MACIVMPGILIPGIGISGIVLSGIVLPGIVLPGIVLFGIVLPGKVLPMEAVPNYYWVPSRCSVVLLPYLRDLNFLLNIFLGYNYMFNFRM